MAQRIYTDSTGVRWTVWAVRPQDSGLSTLRERRAARARRGAPAPEPVIERRHGAERRVHVAPHPSAVQPGYEGGWLVFRDATRHVVRRLAPTPPDWATCDEPRLDAYRQAARPAREVLDGLGRLRSAEPPLAARAEARA